MAVFLPPRIPAHVARLGTTSLTEPMLIQCFSIHSFALISNRSKLSPSRLSVSDLGKPKHTTCKLRDISIEASCLFASSSSFLPSFNRKIKVHLSPSPSSVKEEQPLQDSVDMSPEVAIGDGAKKDLLREAIQRLSQEDLEVSVKKYNLEEELFAEIDFAQVNAFTDRPFSGNPAAICYLPFHKDDQWLQLIAREFNLPVTAFLVKRRLSKKAASEKNEGPVKIENEFDLRWFTPKVELDLCGHATLASAHLLFSCAIIEGDAILFHTKSGILKAQKVSGYEDDDSQLDEGSGKDFIRRKKHPIGHGVIELDFPLVLVSKCDKSKEKQLSEVLGGVEVLWAGCTDMGDYLVEVPSCKDVKHLKPLFDKMVDFSGRGGVTVTACAEKASFDFISRFFCPKAGIPEDPVTGSAHCALGPYWADKLGKNTLEAFQASERGGRVHIRVERSAGRVYLQGGAILVMAGVLLNTMRS